ncbi:ABC transporter permease [Williamsoniiplasma somnilux]|uniref:ABC transporter permease n=1 Tax=Williamsoniiplasma somnilux TaxID=215578 RepID=A0A2K8NXY0_9MOLU|nr:ABC transporter permease [Williamsoniiplasma somnilux]ATZ18647.1 ABC transporter permease [Williamsoniiplasma somnilux]
MRLIIKSYLKTFTKNLTALVGTLIFIIMLTAILVGMLSTPLQLSNKIKAYEDRTVTFDYYGKSGLDLDKDFVYNYIFKNDLNRFIENSTEDDLKINPDLFSETDPTSKGTFLDEIPLPTSIKDLLEIPVLKFDGAEIKPSDDIFVDKNYDSFFGGEIFSEIFSRPIFNKQFYEILAVIRVDIFKQIITNIELGDIDKNDQDEIDSAFANAKAQIAKMIISPLSSFNNGNATSTIGTGIYYVDDLKETSAFFDKRFDIVKNNIIESYKQELENLIKDLQITSKEAILWGSRILFQINSFLENNQMEILGIKDFATITPSNAITEIKKIIEDRFSKLKNKIIEEKLAFDINYLPMMFLNYDFRKELKNNYNNNFVNLIQTKIYDAYNEKNGSQIIEYETDPHFIYEKSDASSVFPTLTIELYGSDNQSTFNRVLLDTGSLAKNPNEIVISPAYAKLNDLSIGDKITVPVSDENSLILGDKNSNSDKKLTSETEFTISGIGIKYDNLAPGKGFKNFVQDFETYAIGYVSNQNLLDIKEARWYYSTKGQNRKNDFINRIKTNKYVNMEKLFLGTKDKTIISVTSSAFDSFDTSPTARALLMTNIQIISYLILGVVFLVLAFVFINFIIKKEINETRRQLGIFKSFGYKVSELSWIFALKTLITMSFGVIVGYSLSIPLQQYSASIFESSVTFDFESVYLNPLFMIIIILIIPLGMMLVSYGVTIYYLLEPTLSLINNGSKIPKKIRRQSLIAQALSKRGKGFTYRIQNSFVARARGKFIIVQTLFAFSSLLYTIMFANQAVIDQTVKQGFASLKSETDHQLYWTNRSKYSFNDISEDSGWYINNKREFEKTKMNYIDYSKSGSVNDELNSSKSSSDSRYRARILLSYVTSKYNETDWGREKIEQVLPEAAILQIIKDKNNETSSINNGTGITDAHYFLNPILSYKIMNESFDNISKEFIEGKDITEILKSWLNDNKNKIDLSSINNGGNIEDFVKEFEMTLFGITASNKLDQYNNIYLSDISRILSFELAQSFATQLAKDIIDESLNKNLFVQDESQIINDVYKQISNNLILKNFNPENDKYWKIINNPLIDLKSLISDDITNPKIEDVISSKILKAKINQTKNQDGLSFTGLSKSAISIITTSMMIDKPNSLKEESIIAINQLLFNKNTETLSNSFEALLDRKHYENPVDVAIYAMDFKDWKYGDIRNNLNFSGVSNDTFATLHNPNFKKDETALKAIIPYAVARKMNWEVNDIVYMTSRTSLLKPFTIQIVGINKSMTFSLTDDWPIIVDYDNYAEQMFRKQAYEEFKVSQEMMFDRMYSNETLLEGKVDVWNISKSISSMKFKGLSLTFSIKNDSSVFMSIFGSMLPELPNVLRVDKNLLLVTNPNLAFISDKSGVAPYNILLATVDNVTQQFNTIMIIFLVLQTFLLAIILIVVMNIIVDEASQIILTMRALGYKTKEINWVVMGKYIIGAIISFIIAYGLSMLIWYIILTVIGNEYQIYIFLPFEWKALVVTFLVLSGIIGLGWYTAYKQVNKRKLNQITNFM